ncbi:MAG TPA: CCA tRNA nucleotidyltransferase, partial [bacterium]|nr:CCA tRNA nucleotidyltransferase [bacterium]
MESRENVAKTLARQRALEFILRLIGEEADKRELLCYAVGGCVRDLFLDRPTTDIDVMVVGDGVQFAHQVADRLRVNTVVAYEKFGTAMIPYRDYDIEVATARSESYTEDSRKPAIEQADVETDAARRDFTINAIAVSLNNETYGDLRDPFHGRRDLKRRLIRTPLAPTETFNEDPLRMLRAIRFAAQLHFKIHKQTLQAIREERERIEIVSRERIRDELLKMLNAEVPSQGLYLLHSTGLLKIILPEFAEMEGVEEREGYHHKDVLHHTFQVVDNVAELTDKTELRLAALVHDIAKPATKRFRKGVGW